jgi:hypothetical protein
MSATDIAPGMAPAMDGTVEARLPYGRLLRLIQAGEVKGARVGKKWFVDLGDLARWRDEQGEPPHAA